MSEQERRRWIIGLIKRGIKRRLAVQVVGARQGEGFRVLESSPLQLKEAYDKGHSVIEVALAASLSNEEALQLLVRDGAVMRRFGPGRNRKKTESIEERVRRCRAIIFSKV